jgi:hypothetical protein
LRGKNLTTLEAQQQGQIEAAQALDVFFAAVRQSSMYFSVLNFYRMYVPHWPTFLVRPSTWIPGYCVEIG